MDPKQFTLFQTFDKRGAKKHGSGSFATFMIIGPVCFFLGIIFSAFPYDYPLLWTGKPAAPEFFDLLEAHLKHMHQAPAIVVRLLQIVVSVGFVGFFIKLFKPSEANLLFDGASLGLYVVAIIVFISNTVKGLRIITLGLYTIPEESVDSGAIALNREESLKVLAASNTILALVLVGVLVLQAGQWYAEKKEDQEALQFEADAAAAAKEKASTPSKAVGAKGGRETRSASGKKKQ